MRESERGMRGESKTKYLDFHLAGYSNESFYRPMVTSQQVCNRERRERNQKRRERNRWHTYVDTLIAEPRRS
jgi:hypothetical protein